MTKPKMLLIDGNSLVHRAFHGLPPLKNKDGLYTNAVYGFTNMLLKLIDQQKPDYISVAFDKKTPTFRHKEYSEYKATRKKTAEELIGQFPILKELLDTMKINRIEIEGYEADDIVGTLAKKGAKEGFEVVIVTGDKDYLQLISEDVLVCITKKGITDVEKNTREVFKEKYGLEVEQFVDLKALMGDSSDNIPGVPGVGEKTGIKLLKEYQTLEGIYENTDKLKGKMKEKIEANKAQAFMSRRLSAIFTDVPLKCEIKELKYENTNQEAVYKRFEELGFKSLLPKDEQVKKQEAKALEFKTRIIALSDLKKIKEEIVKSKEMIFKICERENFILGVSLKYKDEFVYIPAENNLNEIIQELKEFFESSEIVKIGYDLKRDIYHLMNLNININRFDFDVEVARYLVNPSLNDYTIKRIAMDYLNADINSDEDFYGKGRNKKDVSEFEIKEIAKYYTEKLNIVCLVKEKLKKEMEEFEMMHLFNDIEMPLCEVLASMEILGFKVDTNELKEIGKELDIKIEEMTEKIYSYSKEEFNINSPKQLGVVLFEKLGLNPIKKTKTGYSTNAEVLEKLKEDHEIIPLVLEYRQLTKLKSTYVDGILKVTDENSKVHSTFKQTLTTTGRISSTEPNLQNIPVKTEEGRKIRKVFIADDSDYVLVDADYSQIELRVLAHISDDPKLKEAFEHEEDIHTKTAAEVFEVSKEEVTSLMRSRAKAVNFGIIYGISDYGLSRDLGIPRKESKKYIEGYLSNYKLVERYMHEIVKEGKEKGYVSTILNRRRNIPELHEKNKMRQAFGERIAMNTPIQGSAADIIKIAMVNVYNEIKKRNLKSKMILQVHDELIIHTHKDEIEEVKVLLKELMESAVELNVPLKVDMNVGESWYETK